MRVLLPAAIDPRHNPPNDPFLHRLPLRDGAGVALPDGVTPVFLVYTHRCGSNYLAELLAATGRLNRADEILVPRWMATACEREGWPSYSAGFAAVAGLEARGGHFLVKATIGQLALLDWHGLLPRLLPHSRFVVIERMDKIAQAVSWSIANQTGAFISVPGAPGSHVAPVYDGAALRYLLQSLLTQYAQIDEFFTLNGLLPLHLSYETLAAEPAFCLRQVARHLGLPDLVVDPARVRLQRQATGVNETWRRRYLAERFEPVPTEPPAPAAPPVSRFRPVTLDDLQAAGRMLPDGRPAVQRHDHLPPVTAELAPPAFGDIDAVEAEPQRVALPAVAAWLLHDAVLHGSAGIITVGDQVVTESLRGVTLSEIPDARRDADGGVVLPPLRPAPPLAAGYHLLAGNAAAYARWLAEVVGRFSPAAAALLQAAAGAPPVAVVPTLDVHWQWESLALALPEHLANQRLSPEECLPVARLLFVPGLSGDLPALHPALLRVFDPMRASVIRDAPPGQRPWRRLFVAGAPGRTPPVANLPELAALAEQAGFTRVASGDISVFDRARLFAQAAQIIAVSGPDLANLAFCHAGTRLLELHPQGEAAEWYRRLAALRGVHHGRLRGAAGARLDPARLAAVLDDPAFSGG